MIKDLFYKTYLTEPTEVIFTPGRVNLIGEHIDYNGGMVLPSALDLGVTIAIRPRADNRVRVVSDTFGEIAETELGVRQKSAWANYATGAILFANQSEYMSGGADLAISSTIPSGAGLSSSSALTVGILKLARRLGSKAPSDQEIALLARRIENEYIGVPCGIMDQMAVALAKPGQAMALNTKSLDYSLIDLPDSHHFAVIHSGQFRTLTEGHYKIRKEECDAAKKALGTQDLCLLEISDDPIIEALPKPIRKRVRHCVSEHKRTLLAADALRNGNVGQLGALMNASHESMQRDFEMSLPEIDSMVEDAVRLGAVGARLTGGGFGGCIVALVENNTVEDWRLRLLDLHPEAFSVC